MSIVLSGLYILGILEVLGVVVHCYLGFLEILEFLSVVVHCYLGFLGILVCPSLAILSTDNTVKLL